MTLGGRGDAGRAWRVKGTLRCGSEQLLAGREPGTGARSITGPASLKGRAHDAGR